MLKKSASSVLASLSRTVKGETCNVGLATALLPKPFTFDDSRFTDRWTAFLSILRGVLLLP